MRFSVHGRRWGLIPAHAGKTRSSRRLSARGWAHPRSRGENVAALVGVIVAMGSSPLTRGKRGCRFESCRRRGLIPAHAGKTRLQVRVLSEARAHPRSRGENNHRNIRSVSRRGSSPLTRGKHGYSFITVTIPGLIPAHAGKTGGDRGERSHGGAHPRSRGENRRVHHTQQLHPGSSPLTRGKLRDSLFARVVRGLIPAHAGKTTTLLGTLAASRAHPRSRGENGSRLLARSSHPGSSPLTRGKRSVGRDAVRPRGLIPAHAGKTRHLPPYLPSLRAHPRSRGENGQPVVDLIINVGSSPLTRGKRG